MKILLSIKPEFANQIFEGKKKYEFRRTLFKNPNIKTVVVYASTPIKKVIGEFEIESILEDELPMLWEKTRTFSGISENLFYEYFSLKERGYAIKIKSIKRYKNPLSLKEDFNLTPPQSFIYLN